jgi:hypothetical protein
MCATDTSLILLFDGPNNIWYGVQVMKFPITVKCLRHKMFLLCLTSLCNVFGLDKIFKRVYQEFCLGIQESSWFWCVI